MVQDEREEGQASAVEGEEVGRERRASADRRSGNRRRDERRTPPPIWRRPAAYVTYGVLAGFVLVLMVRGLGSGPAPDMDPAAMEQLTIAEPPPSPPPGAAPTREAFTLAQYERLIAEGGDAVGEIVRTELFCGNISPVTVRAGERSNPALVALADADGRAPAAECRWGREARSSDFLLIVPPDLAEEFARAPEVELNFVRRRRIPANVEWLGRSEELALRTAGVLRDIRP
jgi:hypothetical protein